MTETLAPVDNDAQRTIDNTSSSLSELMLAMDVVDTLRHNEQIALSELGQDERDEALKERLKKIYESQGLEVSDQILEDGITALKEDRFTYKPPKKGFSLLLARLWIKRRVVTIFFTSLLALGGIQQVYSTSIEREKAAQEKTTLHELTVTLPNEFKKVSEQAKLISRSPDANVLIQNLLDRGQRYIGQKQVSQAKDALKKLKTVQEELEQTYLVRIVQDPHDYSAVFRIPDVNKQAKNYYLIVEAIDPEGNVLNISILNEENNQEMKVKRWGLRVPENVYMAVGRDKSDDGIIQRNTIGQKNKGFLKPEYTIQTLDGAITKW